jgi:hypothetical protein
MGVQYASIPDGLFSMDDETKKRRHSSFGKKRFINGPEKLKNKIFNSILWVRKAHRARCIWKWGAMIS